MTTQDGSNRPGAPEIGDDPPLREQLAETLRGAQRWQSILVWVDGIVLFVLGVLCAWRFFVVETTWLQIMYATCFLFFMSAVFAIKVWYWMLLFRNQVVRRTNRIEERLDQLARHTHD